LSDPAGDEPIHLVLEDALELYAAIIDASPVQAADHLHNRSGLEGALARPATYAHYQNADLSLPAAVLAHSSPKGSSSSTPTSGSRSSPCSFLELNGYRVQASDPELAAWILDRAAATTPEQLAEPIRAALTAIPG